ncbi:hypothetical protein ASE01_15265 [Nocardioides sp. Root190]|uniref:NADP-dependent oxidoreductase n=1 Tax=Nocardioides sp. Root190 TaxID=1736488 RepID=UPI000700DE0D|nr:NADP-dependent oxidoreductase [Nocardioides sp. Root190]KRB76352.1 hypothetical protein ASE01_15265 [Nocardioides sp. Root190]
MTSSRQWVLRRRADGAPRPEDVELVDAVLPPPGEGEVLVRNEYVSVEPYMQGRMGDRVTYVDPYALDEPMEGPAVGRVVESRAADVPVGTWVRHGLGWRDLACLPAADVDVLDVGGLPPEAFLGVLGQTGLTAYVGLLRIGALQPGETVFVSAAGGAVGSVVGQVARALGCRVIGSVGSAAKATHLEQELGFDAAFSYRDGPVRASLAAALERVGSDGVDVYFDNVAGEQLECALRVMRERGRIVLCGAISTYDATAPVPGPRNLIRAIWQRVRLEGFIVGDHADATEEFLSQMGQWLRDGTVRQEQTVFGGGIEDCWPAFESMLTGGTSGKTLIHVGDGAAPA